MDTKNTIRLSYETYLAGGGEMGEMIRAFDWSSTVLGTPENWSSNLLNTVSIVLRSKFPMFLWWGSELIQFYNDAYRPSLGKNGKHPKALGQRGEDCWPEIWRVIKPLIDQVMAHGESTWSEDQLIPIYRNGKLEDAYWTFSYSKVEDIPGKPGGVLVVCNETTERIRINEAADNAEREIIAARNAAEKERDRLNQFFMQAPAGICVLDGPEFVFELVNPPYQQILPGRQLLNKPLFEALPELVGQPLQEVLSNVYRTGESYEVEELLIPVADYDGGPTKERYFTFNYVPRLDEVEKVDGILVFVFEVTNTVISRKELSKTQDNLKMAVTAAHLGTFDMDVEKGTLFWDERCRTLFGISHSGPVTYENDFLTGLHPDDLERVKSVINNVFDKSISNGEYDVEYRTIGVEDKQLRWVRAMGKAYFDDNDKPLRFVGTVLDITENKLDEIRKNDFIGMVSHELKTPLTSLNAYIQLLHANAFKEQNLFRAEALGKAKQQVKKMSTMIDGFLNVSRLESGKVQLAKTDFDMMNLIKEIIEEMQLTTTSHIINFIPCNPVHVNADRDKIGAVISNLLSNAIKYSPKGKSIKVNCLNLGNEIQVSVHDQGIGIKPQDIDRLFERYYRVESDYTRNISGFGIGLYLSAEMIKGHNGRIWVESEKSVGSTFFFSLPIN